MLHTNEIVYSFSLPNTRPRTFRVVLDAENLGLLPPHNTDKPAWTKMEFCQCENCPLSPNAHPFCPVARNLAPVITAFNDRPADESVVVEVVTAQRRIVRDCSLQEGLRSFFGLIMAASGCPVLDYLKPMAGMHLPFSSPSETAFRSVSTYLLAQYFRNSQNKSADWKLKQFIEMYRQIRKVNESFAKRLKSIAEADANRSAVLRLDKLADVVTFSVGEDWWVELRSLFEPFLRDPLPTRQPALR